MRRLVTWLSVAALLSPLTVTAETFKWVLPTTRLDGSALPSADIVKSTVKCGTQKGGPYTSTKDATGTATSMDAGWQLTTDGWKYCVITTTGKNASAGESSPSSELSFFTQAGKLVLNPLVPAAPSGFSVE